MTIPPFFKKNILYFVFAQALVGTLASLYFSEIRHLPPCILCWYQRIALYPSVLLSAVGIWYNDRFTYRYILPFSIIGGTISIYHNLLYYGVIPEKLAPCTLGISCTSTAYHQVGFISIPLMALAGFFVLTICGLIQWRAEQESSLL